MLITQGRSYTPVNQGHGPEHPRQPRPWPGTLQFYRPIRYRNFLSVQGRNPVMIRLIWAMWQSDQETVDRNKYSTERLEYFVPGCRPHLGPVVPGTCVAAGPPCLPSSARLLVGTGLGRGPQPFEWCTSAALLLLILASHSMIPRLRCGYQLGHLYSNLTIFNWIDLWMSIVELCCCRFHVTETKDDEILSIYFDSQSINNYSNRSN
jgi:hypothetical protein